MDPQRLNLSVLDPSRNTERWERLIEAIGEGAEPALARYRAQLDPLALLSRWTRPVLTSAAAVAVLCVAAWAQLGDGPTVGPDVAADEAADGRIGALAKEWITEARPPTQEELIAIVESEER